MRHATHSSNSPPARISPTTWSNWVTIKAKPMRNTSAAMTPIRMTLRRWSGGSPAARAPTTIALSPASTRSIISTWRKAVRAAGSPMLEKSVTIASQIPAGPPKPPPEPDAAATRRSIITYPVGIARSSKAGTRQSVPPKPPNRQARSVPDWPARLLVHRGEEVLVGLGVLHLVEQELHRVDGPHLHQDPAQHPHFGERRLVDQQFFLAGAGLADVQCREDALVGDLAVEHDLGIAGALELLEDDFVHLRSGVDQGGGDDRQRAAFLDVAGGAEETLRPLQRIGVDAAGQDLARARHHGVVGASQAGDRIEQDDDVL